MLRIEHLISVADEYGRAAAVEEKTVSSRVFHDGKKLASLRGGADITVGRFNDALFWFARNWPDSAVWPEGVPCPVVDSAQ